MASSHLLFLDFSGGEFMLIAVVFLMFFGSKSIPGMARTFGKAVREFKQAANSVQREIHESVQLDESKTSTPPLAPPKTIPEQTNPTAAKEGEGEIKPFS